RSLEHKICDEHYAFWIVQLNAPGNPRTCHLGCDCNQQLVFFPRREIHKTSSVKRKFNRTTSSVRGRGLAANHSRTAQVRCEWRPSDHRRLVRQTGRSPVRLRRSLLNDAQAKKSSPA